MFTSSGISASCKGTAGPEQARGGARGSWCSPPLGPPPSPALGLMLSGRRRKPRGSGAAAPRPSPSGGACPCQGGCRPLAPFMEGFPGKQKFPIFVAGAWRRGEPEPGSAPTAPAARLPGVAPLPVPGAVRAALTRPRYSSSRQPSIHFSVSRRRCSSRRLYLTVTRAWRRCRPGLRAGSGRGAPRARAGDPRPSRLPTRFAAIAARTPSPLRPRLIAAGRGRGRGGAGAGQGQPPARPPAAGLCPRGAPMPAPQGFPRGMQMSAREGAWPRAGAPSPGGRGLTCVTQAAGRAPIGRGGAHLGDARAGAVGGDGASAAGAAGAAGAGGRPGPRARPGDSAAG